MNPHDVKIIEIDLRDTLNRAKLNHYFGLRHMPHSHKGSPNLGRWRGQVCHPYWDIGVLRIDHGKCWLITQGKAGIVR